MKKILVSLLVLSATLFAADQGTEDLLAGLNESGGMAGGALGIGAVHAIFWIPVLIFFAVAGGVIFFYIKQFKQKDDGLFKTIAAGVVGVVLGVLAYTGALKVVDGVFGVQSCGKETVRAYLKDSIAKGLNPAAQFGTNIKAVTCLNN